MSSQNYWFEILLKDADLALSYHDQTYIICVSAFLPKKLNKSTPGYSISVALNSQGFKGEPPLLLCRPLPLFSAGRQGFETPSIPLETGRDWARTILSVYTAVWKMAAESIWKAVLSPIVVASSCVTRLCSLCITISNEKINYFCVVACKGESPLSWLELGSWRRAWILCASC